MGSNCIIQVGAVLVMLSVVAGALWTRRKKGDDGPKGIGVRLIQFLAVGLIVPTVLILSLEGILGSEAAATLLGAATGYVLSGIGKDES